MLQEFFRYLTTPSQPEYRKLGYLKEIVAIEARYGRNKAQWQAHLNNTRRLILESVEFCESRQNLLVLGSGHLLDIPLEALSSQFEKVYLLDVIHPRASLKRMHALPNVIPICHDINGVSTKLGLQKGPLRNLPAPLITLPPQLGEIDHVVSANLLSQLPVIPRSYALRIWRGAPEDMDLWCAQIIAAHLNWLLSLQAQVCLVTDTEHVILDSNNRSVGQLDVLYGIRLPPADRSWEWELVNQKDLDGRHHLMARVSACTVLPKKPEFIIPEVSVR